MTFILKTFVQGSAFLLCIIFGANISRTAKPHRSSFSPNSAPYSNHSQAIPLPVSPQYALHTFHPIHCNTIVPAKAIAVVIDA